MATRFAQVTPEMIATVQGQLERGEVRDFADFCDRMVQREPDIFGAMESRISSISGSAMVIEPAEPTGDALTDELAVMGADLLRRSLALVPSLSQRVHEMLGGGIFVGFSAHEKTYTEADDGAILLTGLHWLHQRRFRYGDDWRLRIVDTGHEFNAQGIELDPDRFVIHQPQVIPGYPTGGALRVVMWVFLFKSLAMQFQHAGAEQFAWPTPVGTLPNPASEAVETALQEAMESFSNGRAAVLREGATMELLESTVKDGGINAALIAECNRSINTALLGMTDLGNPGRVGSYAAVKTRKGATVDPRILKDERTLAEATFEAQIAEPLMRLNIDYFGGIQPRTPRVSWAIPQLTTPIAAEYLPLVTKDEARVSLGLPPIGGAEGAAPAVAPAARAA
jgi:phage gp29-like protein